MTCSRIISSWWLLIIVLRMSKLFKINLSCSYLVPLVSSPVGQSPVHQEWCHGGSHSLSPIEAGHHPQWLVDHHQGEEHINLVGTQHKGCMAMASARQVTGRPASAALIIGAKQLKCSHCALYHG